MTRRFRIVLVAIGTGMLGFATSANAQDCDELKGASTEQAIAYIENGEATQSPRECTFAAFDVIKTLPTKQQIPILLRLLPYTWVRKTDHSISHTGIATPALYYPAVATLLDLGATSEPALLDYIEQDPYRSRKGWENAIFVYALSVQSRRGIDSPHLILLLKHHRAELHDPVAADRIADAIKYLIRTNCGIRQPDITACQAAADAP